MPIIYNSLSQGVQIMTIYYTLIEKTDGLWSPQFGDFDREVVEDEKQDYIDSGSRAKNLRIIQTSPEQEYIDRRIAMFNPRA